jgi:23S rRNA (guanosine2251-2'-O)-methyltransferase
MCCGRRAHGGLRPDGDAVSLYDTALPARAAAVLRRRRGGRTHGGRARADLTVRVPMHGDMDSLNVATAAAVVLSALASRDGAAGR